VLAGIGFGALLYPIVVFGAGVVLTMVLQAMTGEEVSRPQQVPGHLTAIGVSTAILYGVVIAPIHEELFFRGILFRGIRDGHGFWVAGVGSAAAFGLIHYMPGAWAGNVLLIGVMMCTGFALAWFYERRGNVVANMVAHATFNIIGLTLIFALR
jgi:membrane protease YdiL (CAAX protease family)